MGNSNQCKMEHKISIDYKGCQTVQNYGFRMLLNIIGYQEDKETTPSCHRGISYKKWDLKKNVCYWGCNKGVTGLFKYTGVYSESPRVSVSCNICTG